MELKQAVVALPAGADRKLYSVSTRNGRYMMYFETIAELLFGLITEKKGTGNDIPGFIDQLNEEYTKKYSEYNRPHYEFEDKLKSICNERNKESKIHGSINELESVHSVLVKNLDSLINRGENINNLSALADKVNFETKELSMRANQIKLREQMERYKVYGVIGLIVLFVLYLFWR